MMTNETKKKAILTMGLPGSGKSTSLQRVFPETQSNDWVLVDPDKIKESHPDYDPKNPGPLHDWSKKEANKLFRNALTDEQNVIVDGTGTNAERMIYKIKELQEEGYEVTVLYVRVPMAVAIERNAKRARAVPEGIIREKAKLISISFELVSAYADNLKIVDNA